MIGNIWVCPACGKKQVITEQGARCTGKGHQIYESITYLEGYNCHTNNYTKAVRMELF